MPLSNVGVKQEYIESAGIAVLVDIPVWLQSLHASRVKKGKSCDTIYHLYVSGSVVIVLQMAPTAAGVSEMRNLTRCAMQTLECVNCQGSLTSILHHCLALAVPLKTRIRWEQKPVGGQSNDADRY